MWREILHIPWITAYVYFLTLLSSCQGKDENCREKTSSLGDTGASEVNMVVNMVDKLVWKNAVFIYDNNTDPATQTLLVESLAVRSIPLMTYLMTYGDNFENIFTSMSEQICRHFIVLGSYTFIEAVFREVAKYVLDSHSMKLTFDTEWITVISEDDSSRLQSVVEEFENIAILVRTKGDHMSLWTHQRVGNGTRWLRVGPLLSTFSSFTRDQVFPNLSQKLGGRTLRVVIKVVKGLSGYLGVFTDVLKELSIKLNFSYTLHEPPDGSWGQISASGQWDGPIGMLIRKEIDLAIGLFTLTAERSSVADPTHAITYENGLLIYKRPQLMTNWLTFFVEPFQVPVFVIIVISFGSVAFLVLTLECLQKRHDPYTSTFFRPGHVFWWNLDIVEILVAGLLNKSTTDNVLENMQSRASRVLVCSWLLLSVLLASLYSSKLTATLTANNQSLPITSVSDLVNQDRYTWGLSSGTAVESIFKNSANEDYKKLYNKVLKWSEKDPSIRSMDMNVQVPKLQRGNYAFVSETRAMCQQKTSQCCDFVLIPVKYIRTDIVCYLQKGSPFTKAISKEIGRMFDTGLIDYWKRKWQIDSYSDCDREPEVNDVKSIGLAETQTAFYFACAGLGLGALTLGFEYFLMFTRTLTLKRRLRETRNKE